MFGLGPMELIVLGLLALIVVVSSVWAVRNATRKK
jgi:hypothetical protein